MRSLVATQEFRYDGKQIAVGDEFEAASDNDAKVLEAMGRAKPGATKHARSAPKTRAMKAHDGAAPISRGEDAAPEPGRYNRTDMRAED